MTRSRTVMNHSVVVTTIVPTPKVAIIGPYKALFVKNCQCDRTLKRTMAAMIDQNNLVFIQLCWR